MIGHYDSEIENMINDIDNILLYDEMATKISNYDAYGILRHILYEWRNIDKFVLEPHHSNEYNRFIRSSFSAHLSLLNPRMKNNFSSKTAKKIIEYTTAFYESCITIDPYMVQLLYHLNDSVFQKIYGPYITKTHRIRCLIEEFLSKDYDNYTDNDIEMDKLLLVLGGIEMSKMDIYRKIQDLVVNNRLEFAKFLMQSMNINVKSESYRPLMLMYYCKDGDLESFMGMYYEADDLHSSSKDEKIHINPYTMFKWSSFNGHLNIVKLLIDEVRTITFHDKIAKYIRKHIDHFCNKGYIDILTFLERKNIVIFREPTDGRFKNRLYRLLLYCVCESSKRWVVRRLIYDGFLIIADQPYAGLFMDACIKCKYCFKLYNSRKDGRGLWRYQVTTTIGQFHIPEYYDDYYVQKRCIYVRQNYPASTIKLFK